MKNKPLLIGASVLATIAVAGASAWMVNAEFISSPVAPHPATLVATTPIVPTAKLQLRGAAPNATPVSTELPAAYPEGAGFCDAAKNPTRYPEPAKTLFPGKNGWVFRQDEMLWPSKPVTPLLHNAVRILQKHLNKTDTKLIILVSPPRNITGARNLDGLTTAHTSADLAKQLYNNLLAELRKDGAYVPDILAEADYNQVGWDQLSDPADRHWSALGAKMAADATSRIIQSDAQFAKASLTKFKVERNGADEAASDYFDVLAGICGTKSLSKYVKTFSTVKIQGIANDLTAGKKSGPIVLAGTSFTAREKRYNYAGFLSEGTGLEVRNLSSDGDSAVQSLVSYLSSGALLRERPRFLVWEMSPQNLPDPNSAAQVEAYADPGCSLLGQASAVFDWNETKIFNSDVFQRYSGTRAKLILTSSNRSLREFKIITHYHDGRTDQINVNFAQAKFIPNQFKLVLPDISGAKSISIKPATMMAGNIKAQMCGMDA